MCRVHLCNRKAVPNSNLCEGHYRQLVDRALNEAAIRKQYEPCPNGPDCTIHVMESESEARVMDGNR